MPNVLIRNRIMPGRDHNYDVAGNLCNAFVLGAVGSSDDFFLVAAEPPPDSNYPLLTGNFLDAEGRVLFRLVRNMMVVNPGRCGKILSDRIGYEIHDANDKLVLRVSTIFAEEGPGGEASYITTIAGNFYDKAGRLVFRANSGEPDERIELEIKGAFGFKGGFGMVFGLSTQESQVAAIALGSGGRIHELVTGPVENQRVNLDGKILLNAHLRRCVVHVRTGDFVVSPDSSIAECEFALTGPAMNIRHLVETIHAGRPSDAPRAASAPSDPDGTETQPPGDQPVA